ncbi:MAG TPA: hypothetical protein VEX14_05015 [Burkholderiaceae bacterium]|nr:hypothetical protein [Burkholderiaceae bacterium]
MKSSRSAGEPLQALRDVAALDPVHGSVAQAVDPEHHARGRAAVALGARARVPDHERIGGVAQGEHGSVMTGRALPLKAAMLAW